MSINETEIDNLPAFAQEPDKTQFVASSKACRIIMGHIRDTLPGDFRFEDIWPFVKDLLESGAITGFINGQALDPICLANKDNYKALWHGDDLRLPVVARHANSMGHFGREIAAICDGPVYFELGELKTALAKTKPEFVDDGEFDGECVEPTDAGEAPSNGSDRAGKGGRIKMPLRVAISMAIYYIFNRPTADFQEIFDDVRGFWENANENSSADTAYLKYMLRPVYEISRAQFNEDPFSKIEKLANTYAAEDLKKNEGRRVVTRRPKALSAKRQGETDQPE